MIKLCRTYSGWDINWKEDWNEAVKNIANENFDYNIRCSMSSSHMKDGRGNIAPATIILPTLAMEAKKKSKDNPEYIVDYFMNILEEAISDCKDELIERFNWICAQNPASAKFMYENNTFYSYGDEFEKEGIRGALKHGSLAIGQIGLYETLQILIGSDHTTKKGMELAKKIEKLFNEKCKEYKEEWRKPILTFDSIKKRMVKKAEEEKGEELSQKEIKEIEEYIMLNSPIQKGLWKK